jgi:hypothetical protein
MSVERIICRIPEILRNHTTKQDTVHLIVDVIVFVPARQVISGNFVYKQFIYSSNVSKISVFGVLKFGSWSSGTNQ